MDVSAFLTADLDPSEKAAPVLTLGMAYLKPSAATYWVVFKKFFISFPLED